MSKTICVVERTDNHGEFQPLATTASVNRDLASDRMEDLLSGRTVIGNSQPGARYRLMQYVRREARS